jgi:TP901 family phage tail tape measure protein
MAESAGSVELEVKLSRGQLDRQLSQVERDLASLKDREVKVSADFSKVSAAVTETQAKLRQLQADKANIVAIGGDTKAISAEIAKVKASLGDLKNKQIELKLSKDTLTRDLSQAQAQLGKLKQVKVDIDASGLKSKLAGLASEFGRGISQGVGQSISNQVVAAGGAAIGQLNIADSGIKQNAATVKVSTLADDTPAVTAALKALSGELGNAASSTELINSAYDVLSAKTSTLVGNLTNAQLTTKILDAATKGAIGGFSDTNTVADALTSTLNAYGKSADEAASFVDKFAATQNAGKITIDQYAQQIGKVAPLAAQAGVGLDELNGFIATATVSGVSVESTFSGIRQALAAVLKPTAEAATLSKALGVEFDAAALRSKGLSGILQELNAKGADTPEVLTQLFGSVEAVAAIAPSAGTGIKNLTANIAASADSAGTAQKAFEKVAGSYESQIKALQNATDDFKANSFEALTPAIEGISGLFKSAFSELDGGQAFFDSLNASATEFKSTLEANPEIAKALAEALSQASEAFGDAAVETLKGLTTALAENPQLIRESIDEFGGFLKLVIDTVSAVVQLSAQIAGVVGKAQELSDIKIPFAGKAGDLIKPIINPLGAAVDAKDALFGRGKKAAKRDSKGFTVAPGGGDLKAKTEGQIGPQAPTPKADGPAPAKPKPIDVKAIKGQAKQQKLAAKEKKKAAADAEKDEKRQIAAAQKAQRKSESEQKKALAAEQSAQKKAESQAKAALDAQKKAAEEKRKQQLEQFDRGFATQARTIDNRASDQSFSARSKQFKSGSGDASAATDKADRQATKERIVLKQQELAGIRGLVAKGIITEKEGADRRLKIEQDLRGQREQLLQQQQQAFVKKLQAETDAAKRSSGIRIALLDKEKAANDLLLQSLDRQNQLRQAGDNLVNARSDQAQSRTGIDIARATEGVDVARQLQSQDTGANLRRVLQQQAGQLGGSDVLGALRQQQQLQAQADAQRLAALRQQQSQEALSLELGLKQQQITAKNNALEADRAVILAKQNAIEAAGNLLKAKRLGDANEVANAKQAVDLAKQGISLAEAQAKAAQDNIAAQTALAKSAQDVLTIKQLTALEEAKAAAQANSRQRQRDFAGAADQQGQFLQSFGNSAVPIARSDPRRQQFVAAQAQLSGIGGSNQFQQSQRSAGLNGLGGKEVLSELQRMNGNLIEIGRTPRSISLTTADPMADLARVQETNTGNRLRGL